MIRIHQLKGRGGGKSSAVMYFSPLAMRELVAGLGPRTAAAVSALLPGPVTLVVANPERRYPLACREDPERLGVRLLAGPLAGAMCPVFQTSRQPQRRARPAASRTSPTEILAGVDLAIDGGELTGLPSTVIDLAALDDGRRPGRSCARARSPRATCSAPSTASASTRPQQPVWPLNGSRTSRREVLSSSFDS